MRVLVIGGGAAGMMAAIAAGRAGAEVLLAEKNEKLGKKLYITGKGRCNVTNASPREEFFGNICTNARFLYGAFSRFSNYDMMELMEQAGVPLKTERGNRVFPVSDHSADIQRGLDRLLKAAGVKIRLNTKIHSLLIEEGCCVGAEILTEGGRAKEILRADRVIVATGGLGYPSTGSTGDGYRFAERAGHSVTERFPALVPLNASFSCAYPVAELMGLSLKNIAVSFRQGQRELASDFGEMLFTHFGVSGPVILSASCLIGKNLQKETVEQEGPVRLFIDLKPALTREQLEERFQRETSEPGANLKQTATYLAGWLPRALIAPVLKEAGVPGPKKLAALSKKEKESIFRVLKALPMEIQGLRDYNEAIVTKGGVSVKEIAPATMESKKVKHLYFAGEVLDLDAYTGGFNLQIAWSTGHAAGTGAAKEDEA